MVDFGFAITPGPVKGKVQQWQTEYDEIMPDLAGHVKSLWVTDHFFWEDMPTHECWTTMTYFLTRYPDFEVGSSVVGQSYRNPALTAKMGATLQTLSNGRFILGIGAGWKDTEYLGYGYDFPSAKIRLQQLKDTLEIIRRLWEEEGAVSYQGEHYHIQDAYCEPKPDPVPKIMVGGGGKTTMRHAAQYADWWNLSDVLFDEFKERQDILESHCQDIERDFSTIRKTRFCRLSLGKSKEEAIARAEREGRTHYAGWTVDGAFVGTPEQVREAMQPYIDIGVDYFMLEVLNAEQPDIRQMFVEEVIGKVNS